MTSSLSPVQFSDYDERPDPKKPGQQGVLFRHEAPARGTPDQRRGITTDRWGDQHDTRIDKGRATGLVPTELFHGTAANLRPGSVIRPGMHPNFPTGAALPSKHGKSLDVNREHAFATPDKGEAYRYSRIAQESGNWQNPRPHVFKVQPVGPIQVDQEARDTAQEMSQQGDMYDEESPPGGLAFQSKQGFKITGRVPLPDAQESYRSFNEDELGQEPGTYEFAPKTPEQKHEARWGW